MTRAAEPAVDISRYAPCIRSRPMRNDGRGSKEVGPEIKPAAADFGAVCEDVRARLKRAGRPVTAEDIGAASPEGKEALAWLEDIGVAFRAGKAGKADLWASKQASESSAPVRTPQKQRDAEKTPGIDGRKHVFRTESMAEGSKRIAEARKAKSRVAIPTILEALRQGMTVCDAFKAGGYTDGANVSQWGRIHPGFAAQYREAKAVGEQVRKNEYRRRWREGKARARQEEAA